MEEVNAFEILKKLEKNIKERPQNYEKLDNEHKLSFFERNFNERYKKLTSDKSIYYDLDWEDMFK